MVAAAILSYIHGYHMYNYARLNGILWTLDIIGAGDNHNTFVVAIIMTG